MSPTPPTPEPARPRQLWAPWRMDYLRRLAAEAAPGSPPASDPPPAVGASEPQAASAPPPPPPPECFLCEAAAVAGDPQQAQSRLVLLGDHRGVLLLNRYPYTNGHLMAAVADHLPDLTDLTAPQRAGLMELVVLGEELLRAAVHAQGINVGINLGRCAGAGVPGHLHVHLVPRWGGDVNFMDTVGGARVIPQALEESWAWMRQVLRQMEGGQGKKLE